MLVSRDEQRLCCQLRDLPSRYNCHFSAAASRELFQILFRSLAGRGDYLPLLFPGGPPTNPDARWSLRDAQGAVEGAEYTAAARGKPCGHIFKNGEATYRCKTCAADETCVLCARCFDASDHQDHQVYVSVSPGNSGCCDCGDDEAWNRPVHCNIHSAAETPTSKSAGKAKQGSPLPDELMESIRMTIARALDYLIDVFSCSPEQLRLPKTEQSILEDERTSRLTSKWYGTADIPQDEQEYVLVLWNDEKHTVVDVRDQVARACKQRREFGLAKAHEVDDIGRSTIIYRSDIKELLRMAKIIEEIKLTVTIRSARDTFREQMGGAIIEWISDIAGCSVGTDNQILRRTVCEELLKPWRIGSVASHQHIGQDGLYDHEDEEEGARRNTAIQRRAHMVALQRIQNATQPVNRTADENVGDTAGSDADAESVTEMADDMEIDDLTSQDNDGDVDMEAFDSADEALEISEATIAGYPPPPPPPEPNLQTVERRQEQNTTPAESDSEPMATAPHLSHVEPSLHVPATPRPNTVPMRPFRPAKYWLEKPDDYGRKAGLPPHEDIWQRLRLDHLILYDLRMWKRLRIGVRDVFISTVVTIPEFKRLLGLRFAGVYTALAQLYLIADREPDHSIINLSLQMLTTPSITAEVVERGNFLTNLLAILYTFLTTRQVGYPWNVDPKATLAFEQGAVTNRRMYHFFLDTKYLLGSEHIQERIREEDRYLLQFLDLVKLHQGICPNVRVVGEHVEYETEAWISASIITREINKLCRQFSESFAWSRDEDPTSIRRAIRSAAKVVIVNSLGAERKRFDQAELKGATRFKTLEVFEFEAEPSTFFGPSHKIVDYVVAKEHMSFHHALHYTLSWLIDRGRSMPRDHLLNLLLFRYEELLDSSAQNGLVIPNCQTEEYLLALFDLPLRVVAWLSQMKAGAWVRNGITLRHQMTQYRSVSQRDLSYQRDIFLLQTALVLCNPTVFLASMVDRFGLLDWMTGRYTAPSGFEESQAVDIVEDFVHLLIILISDRTSLIPPEDDSEPQTAAMRRDIAHVLCFKPLSYSDLTARLSDRVQNADEFSDVLSEMTKFKAPEGLSDTGTFELREQCIELIDPYIHHYSKNQREEAENIYKNYMTKKTGKESGDIVFEPKLRQISSGLFQNLSEFTRQPLFTQIIYYLLGYSLVASTVTPTIPTTRVETYVQFVLQLLLVAVLEDKSEPHEWSQDSPDSFVTSVLTRRANVGLDGHPTILSILKALSENEAFKSCQPKIKLILHRMKQRQQGTFIIASETLHMSADRMDTASPASINLQEKEDKKKQALERQARVLASFGEQQRKFLANQNFDWGEDDFSDLEDESDKPVTEHAKLVKYPAGTCILCQEETNEQRLYGTFGYLSESRILRLTDMNDDDWVEEVAQTPVNLDRSAEYIRPFGVSGKNRRTVEKITSAGERVLTEKQDLGKGFPYTQTRKGPVSTGCGHIMHYACFEVYLQATQRRHVSQIARNHPESPHFKEFMCPLCKALGNIFLPVIWKGKRVSYPGALETTTSFDDWIGSQVAINISKWGKSHEGPNGDSPANLSRQHKAFFDYVVEEFIQPVGNRVSDLVKPTFVVVLPVSQPSTSNQFAIPAQVDDPREPQTLPSENNSAMAQNFPMVDLVRVYQRLRDTFRANTISSMFAYPPSTVGVGEDLIYTDALAKTLGFSISAIEIAQRGVQSDSMRGTLLDKISPQALTHLRIYSETVSSYIAIGSLRNNGASKTMEEFMSTQNRQQHQLFIGHPNMFDPDILPFELKGIAPLLVQDPFIFLSECSLCLVPTLNLDIHHVLRLCYFAEIVRVILAFVADDQGLLGEDSGGIKIKVEDEKDDLRVQPDRSKLFINSDKIQSSTFGEVQMQSLFYLICRMHNTANLDASPSTVDLDSVNTPSHAKFGTPGFLEFIYTMVSTYALPFLRKAAVLMHVRYGVEVPHIPHEHIDAPEIDRLSSLLKLPSLHEMISSFGADSPGGHATRSIVGGWIRHWVWAREGKRPLQPSISLSHPAIFELVGLPKNYDMLTDEAMRRKCPISGKELTDPCVCLFCGEIMCSQGVCCMNGSNRGGCNQHQTKCGGNIGLFINIRKCMVLFLNLNNGTWAVAPYLDKHGEVDPTLRRHHQLFLNQKRYDVLLRKVWLEGGIQSLIARRLEGDINNGGWETL
ncbi:RING finger domain-containing protein [Amniculicola lignicola CBS 123094]|uniref:E3 ubiquitin-protein ligase n=1 Tax=Amniculicola lignicola CBS 123094 TaxID=1392246 RepID=A0A6A5WY22_9PLEO|nr:RING finger domain-containing protein [Amniculicola lignicola CBS 123094]